MLRIAAFCTEINFNDILLCCRSGVLVAGIIGNSHILVCENSFQEQYDTAFVRIFLFSNKGLHQQGKIP